MIISPAIQHRINIKIAIAHVHMRRGESVQADKLLDEARALELRHSRCGVCGCEIDERGNYRAVSERPYCSTCLTAEVMREERAS